MSVLFFLINFFPPSWAGGIDTSLQCCDGIFCEDKLTHTHTHSYARHVHRQSIYLGAAASCTVEIVWILVCWKILIHNRIWVECDRADAAPVWKQNVVVSLLQKWLIRLVPMLCLKAPWNTVQGNRPNRSICRARKHTNDFFQENIMLVIP